MPEMRVGEESRPIMCAIASNLQAVRARIAATGKSPAVQLLAVSKTFPAEAVREAVAAGQTAFGENYVQEGIAKIAALADLRSQLTWHFIGPLQSNKTRQVAEFFDWVHTVDRLKIAQRLAEQRPTHLPSLNICLQINISGEPSKSGLAPQEAAALAAQIAALPHLQLRGLMAIPAPADTPAAQRLPFAAMRQLFEQIRQQLGSPAFDTLSMGMSADLEAAILEGATLIRVGTAIFGTRPHA